MEYAGTRLALPLGELSPKVTERARTLTKSIPLKEKEL